MIVCLKDGKGRGEEGGWAVIFESGNLDWMDGWAVEVDDDDDLLATLYYLLSSYRIVSYCYTLVSDP